MYFPTLEEAKALSEFGSSECSTPSDHEILFCFATKQEEIALIERWSSGRRKKKGWSSGHPIHDQNPSISPEIIPFPFVWVPKLALNFRWIKLVASLSKDSALRNLSPAVRLEDPVWALESILGLATVKIIYQPFLFLIVGFLGIPQRFRSTFDLAEKVRLSIWYFGPLEGHFLWSLVYDLKF